jgi:SEC-C motif
MSRKKIGRNDPCPCGSNKKYKKCHLDREAAAPLPYFEFANELLRLRAGEKKCLHPSITSPCTGKVIRAHSISRSTALAKIARDGEVYQLDTNPFTINKIQGNITLKLANIASATTFTGFCSSHDNSLFEPIDGGNLTPTKEEVLLLHYRALCREAYVKQPISETNELLRELDRGRPVEFQAMVQDLVSARGAVIDESIKQLGADKAQCDRAITQSDYTLVRGAYILFRQLPSVACSGYAQPSFDFAAQLVQDIDDMTKPYFNCSFTLLPNGTGGIAVFAWLDNADSVCRSFVQSLFNLPNDRKSDALVQYTFDSFENFAAQPEWWEALSATAQAALRRRVLNWTDIGGINSSTLITGSQRFADWEVDSFGWI